MSTLASILILVGAVLALIAAIGLHRFTDVFARMHAATKPLTLGLVLTLAGAIALVPGSDARAKLSLVILLQLITAPIAAHLVGRATYRRQREESRAVRHTADDD